MISVRLKCETELTYKQCGKKMLSIISFIEISLKRHGMPPNRFTSIWIVGVHFPWFFFCIHCLVLIVIIIFIAFIEINYYSDTGIGWQLVGQCYFLVSFAPSLFFRNKTEFHKTCFVLQFCCCWFKTILSGKLFQMLCTFKSTMFACPNICQLHSIFLWMKLKSSRKKNRPNAKWKNSLCYELFISLIVVRQTHFEIHVGRQQHVARGQFFVCVRFQRHYHRIDSLGETH